MSVILSFSSEIDALGWNPIPLDGKKPVEYGWQRYCEEKRQWRKEDFFNRNVGIPCGPASGIIAVEIDDVDEFNRMCGEKGWRIPYTRTHKTGSGHPHYIYRYPTDGRRYRYRAFKNKDGGEIFSIRALGSQIVAPGSIHPETGKPYTVINDAPIADPPQWVIEETLEKEAPKQTQAHPIQWDGNLDLLPVSLGCKKLIREGESQGGRSEAIMSVVNALVAAKVGDEAIFSIFETFPIGEKYREKGRSRQKWLERHIQKARGFVRVREETPAKSLSISDLMAMDFPETQEIISEGILPAGGGLILAGEGGVGKSLIILEWVVRLAVGWQILDLNVPSARTVQIFQSENPLQQVKFRLNKIRLGLGLGRLPEFFLNEPSNRFNLSHRGDIDRMRAIIEQNQADVFVIDPLSSFHTLNENDNIQIRAQVLDNVTEISRRTGAAAIVVHHFGKPVDGRSNRYRTRGASSIQDWADTLISITDRKHEHKTLRQIDFIKIRNGPERKSQLVERDNDFIHHLTEEDMLVSTTKVKEILDNCFGGRVDKQSELLAAISEQCGCTQRTAATAVKRAVEMKYILETIKGRTKGYFSRK
jgi:hypothetical protein